MFNVMSSDISPIKLTIQLLYIAGFFRNKDWLPSILLAVYQRMMLCLLFFTSMGQFFFTNSGIYSLIEFFSVIIAVLHLLSKLFYVYNHQTEILMFLNKLESLRSEMLEDCTNNDVLIKKEKFLRKFVVLFFVILNLYIFLLEVINVIKATLDRNGEYHFVLQLYFPWEINNLSSFLVSSFIIIIILLTGTSVYSSCNIFIITITIELSAITQVLQAKLRKLKLNDTNVYRQHKELIQLIQDFNKIYSGQLYFEIALSSSEPVGFGYLLIKTIRNMDSTIIDIISKFLYAMMGPFIICACGQEINTQLQKLHDYSYMNLWYEEKPELRKSLLMLMTYTNQPTAVNYRHFVTFNYSCYASVIHGIYTYLTMISNFESS